MVYVEEERQKQNFILVSMEITKAVVFVIIGMLIGLFVYDSFFVPEITTKVETKVRTEYIPVTIPVKMDDFKTIYLPKPVFIRDTVIKEIAYPINKYTGVDRSFLGNLHYEITTAGELIDFKFKPDFKIETSIPQTTITTDRTTTVVKNRSLYATGSFDQINTFGVGATYLSNKFLLGYSYYPTTKVSQLKMGYRLF